MNEFLDFKGEVSLYENGNLKWTKSNKITYQGRAALLKNLSHSLSINKTYGNSFLNHIDANSYLCGIAFGNGGTMNGSVLNNNTSYNDHGLFNPIPIRQLSPEQMVRERPEYEEEFSNYIAYTDERDASERIACHIDNAEDSNLDINILNQNMLYFKKISSVTSVNSMSMHDDSNKYKFKTSFVTFSFKIDQADFKYFSSLPYTSISELGLYLGSLQYDVSKIHADMMAKHGEDPVKAAEEEALFDPRQYCQDGQDMVYKKPEYEAKLHNCSYFVKESLPVMFSHITFPAEDIIEPKDLTFKYTIFV